MRERSEAHDLNHTKRLRFRRKPASSQRNVEKFKLHSLACRYQISHLLSISCNELWKEMRGPIWSARLQPHKKVALSPETGLISAKCEKYDETWYAGFGWIDWRSQLWLKELSDRCRSRSNATCLPAYQRLVLLPFIQRYLSPELLMTTLYDKDGATRLQTSWNGFLKKHRWCW